ncbi:MAG: helix-turn-helix transcriptional regulator [Aigarchaeota archaeon]|nr:helix-turn-helix transcriptional regulator [Candidatus Pelearchaeum maunauluense]
MRTQRKIIKEVNDEICPIVESLMRIKSIWRLVVIRFLLDGPKGFNELLRTIPEINPKTLSRALKTLQEDGLIERKIINTRPFLVKYQLTQKGLELKPTLVSLRRWGNKWVIEEATNTPKSKNKVKHFT